MSSDKDSLPLASHDPRVLLVFAHMLTGKLPTLDGLQAAAEISIKAVAVLDQVAQQMSRSRGGAPLPRAPQAGGGGQGGGWAYQGQEPAGGTGSVQGWQYAQPPNPPAQPMSEDPPEIPLAGAAIPGWKPAEP